MGSPTFERAVKAIEEIHRRFDRQFEEKTLEALPERETGNESMGLWNRYLTPRREAGGVPCQPFLAGMDPKGVLADVVRRGLYIHTEDNQVHYYEAHRNPGGGPLRYVYPAKKEIYQANDATKI